LELHLKVQRPLPAEEHVSGRSVIPGRPTWQTT